MKTKLLYRILFTALALAALTGCGGVNASGGSQPTPSPTPLSTTPTPSPSPTPTPAAVASHFIYGIQAFESDIGYAGGQINSATGQITSVGTPFNDSGLGQNIVIQLISDPQGRFLYGLNLGANAVGTVLGTPGIAEMQINQQTGALSRVAGSPVIFASQILGTLAIDKTGHFLYQPDAGAFDVYTINQSTGLLTKTTPSAATSIGIFTTISPDGRFLFNASDDTVESLSIDANGNLAVVQPPVVTGGSAVGVVGQLTVSADNHFLYVLNQGSVSIFNIGSTGTLTPVIGSPFLTDPGGNGLALTPDGKHVYISFQANDGTNSVKGYTFDSTANTLTPIAGAAISDNAKTVTVDGSGNNKK